VKFVSCIRLTVAGGGVQGREREGGHASEGCQQGGLRLPRHQGLPGSPRWSQVRHFSLVFSIEPYSEKTSDMDPTSQGILDPDHICAVLTPVCILAQVYYFSILT